MSFRNIIAMVIASFVFITAASGTTSLGTYRTRFVAPTDANQKISESESSRYQPPRSPGFNDVSDLREVEGEGAGLMHWTPSLIIWIGRAGVAGAPGFCRVLT